MTRARAWRIPFPFGLNVSEAEAPLTLAGALPPVDLADAWRVGDSVLAEAIRLVTWDPGPLSPEENQRICIRVLAIAALKAIPNPTAYQTALLRAALTA